MGKGQESMGGSTYMRRGEREEVDYRAGHASQDITVPRYCELPSVTEENLRRILHDRDKVFTLASAKNL